MIDFDNAIGVIKRIYGDTADLPSCLVLVGGTALAAHRIRKMSEDIDFYAKSFPEQRLLELEFELKKQYGESFKIDATSTENIRGQVMLRDIEDASTQIQSIDINGKELHIKALSIEDLYLLKLIANRPKDKIDLPLIAEKTNFDKLIARANQQWQNIGNRDMVLGILDDFVNRVAIDFTVEPKDIISALSVPAFYKDMLLKSHCDSDLDSDASPR